MATELRKVAICEEEEAARVEASESVLATELRKVAVCEEEAARVDASESVLLASASAFAKVPKSGAKSAPLQQPAFSSSLPSRAPQHQLLAAKEPLFTGQGYRLLKLSVAES